MNNNQSKKDLIANQLGLANLSNFSWKDFLSGTFAPHSWEEFEIRLCVGTKNTTPEVNMGMSIFPKPWMFVRMLASTLLGYCVLLLLLTIYKEEAIYALPALIIFGCFAIPFAVLTFFFEMNTPQNVSFASIAKIIFVGGAISFLVTFLLFDYFPLQKIYGPSSAGIIEEISKLAVVVILTKNFMNDRHKFILNGILYGAAIGTGFAAFESAGYALVAGLTDNSFSSLNHIILMRGILSPFTHIVWSAMAGGALWISYRESNRKTIWGVIFNFRFLSLFVIPVALHFLWNSDIAMFWGIEGHYFPFQMIVLGMISWIIILRFLATGFKDIQNDLNQIN